MKSKVILLSLSIIFLSGCVREESPIWYMTSSDQDINKHFKKTCLRFGHSEDSPSDLNNCIKVAREASAKDANNRLYQAGQMMQQMDMQRIQNHNTAVSNYKNSFPKLTNVYDSDGQLRAYSKNGNWYNSGGEYIGFIKNNNIYDNDGQYVGFIKGSNYYNADGSYAGQSR